MGNETITGSTDIVGADIRRRSSPCHFCRNPKVF
jgi:hypothetical protein